ERIAAILALEQAEWGLDAVLDLHRGLLDHAEAVRLASVEALKAIAQRSPEQLTLTPASFLAHHMFSFTVASGAAEGIFGFLVELGTPEGDERVVGPTRAVQFERRRCLSTETRLGASRTCSSKRR